MPFSRPPSGLQDLFLNKQQGIQPNELLTNVRAIQDMYPFLLAGADYSEENANESTVNVGAKATIEVPQSEIWLVHSHSCTVNVQTAGDQFRVYPVYTHGNDIFFYTYEFVNPDLIPLFALTATWVTGHTFTTPFVATPGMRFAANCDALNLAGAPPAYGNRVAFFRLTI